LALVASECFIEAPRQLFHVDHRDGRSLIKIIDSNEVIDISNACASSSLQNKRSELNSYPPRAGLEYKPTNGNVTSFNATIKVPSAVTSPNQPRILFSQRLSPGKLAADYFNLGAAVVTRNVVPSQDGDASGTPWMLFFSYTNRSPSSVWTSMPLRAGDNVRISMTFLGDRYVGNNQNKPCWHLKAQSLQDPLNSAEMNVCIDWAVTIADLNLWSLFITDCAVDYPPSPYVWQSVSVGVNGTKQSPAWSPFYSVAGTCHEQIATSNSNPSTVRVTWNSH